MKIVIQDGPEPTVRPENAHHYPAGWFDDPIAVITGKHMDIHRRLMEQPWAQDPIRLGRWLRGLVELRNAQPRRRGYLSPTRWTAILEAFDYRCAYCGATDVFLEKDHRIPWSKGGADDESNIVPACKPCNRAKRDQPAERWPLAVVPRA